MVVYNTWDYWVLILGPLSASPEDGNRSDFRDVVFFRIPDGGQSPRTQ
jgi:hypothetical protein